MNITYRVIDPKDGTLHDTGEYDPSEESDRRHIAHVRRRATNAGMIFATLSTSAAHQLLGHSLRRQNERTAEAFRNAS